MPRTQARKPRPSKAPDVAPWPADHVERRPLDELIPYARNARTHSDAQVAELAAAIRQWGWTMPVLVDEHGVLIAGHGRVLAARRLELVEVPVMVARGWSEAQIRAYRLADNKLALNAGWDEELLAIEITDLRLAEFDLNLTGFSSGEMGRVLDQHNATGEAKLPDDLSYQLIIECVDEKHQVELLEEMRHRELKCRPLIL